VGGLLGRKPSGRGGGATAGPERIETCFRYVTCAKIPSTNLSRHPTGRSDAVVATVRYIGAAGPVVRLELQREDSGSSLDAEISRERFRELNLSVGDKVDVIARNLRVFTDELGSRGAGI
jgi:hypothetical protein